MAGPSTRHNPPAVHGRWHLPSDCVREVHTMQVDSRRQIDSDHVHRRLYALSFLSATHTRLILINHRTIPVRTLGSPPTTRTHRTSSLVDARIPCPCVQSLLSSHLVTSRPPRCLPLSLSPAQPDPLKLSSLIKPCLSRHPPSRV
ncbi:hypothetical protein BDN70DRAFT_382716 [Pholiota conissans]|uniref:Uncharacterized protein n=1 Tax=Pholiota conissans TaxID=109636 RepID=A0A9P5YRQ0_9AGAR|nr:hypothetical protein BDN70DRAFT_382716 [Pholiota conissans]